MTVLLWTEKFIFGKFFKVGDCWRVFSRAFWTAAGDGLGGTGGPTFLPEAFAKMLLILSISDSHNHDRGSKQLFPILRYFFTSNKIFFNYVFFSVLFHLHNRLFSFCFQLNLQHLFFFSSTSNFYFRSLDVNFFSFQHVFSCKGSYQGWRQRLEFL